VYVNGICASQVENDEPESVCNVYSKIGAAGVVLVVTIIEDDDLSPGWSWPVASIVLQGIPIAPARPSARPPRRTLDHAARREFEFYWQSIR